MDTVRDSSWGQQRVEDQAWFAVVRRYDGVILLIITAILMIGGVMAWTDRRDYSLLFGKVNENITALTAQASAMQAVLTRVERQVGILSTQNERWVSWERELLQLRIEVQKAHTELSLLRERVQRIEDQRVNERETGR